MRKLLRYRKNDTETNAYWNDVKWKLKTTINQVGAPTLFWTLSYVEFHRHELHSFFSDDELSEPETLRKNIVNNPQLLD